MKKLLLTAIAAVMLLAISVSSLTGCEIDLSVNALLGLPEGTPGITPTTPNTPSTPSEKYTVTFDSNGGSAVVSKTVVSGSKLLAPASPTKPGYIFAGWYLGEELWVFAENTGSKSITLKAKWIAETSDLTVTFNTNGGSIVPTAIIPASGKISRPAAPEKLGYSFECWVTANGSAWDFSSDIAKESIVLNALWSITDYSITYDLGSEDAKNAPENPDFYNIETPLTALSAPSLDGYVFIGWTVVGTDAPAGEVSIGGGAIGEISLVATWELAPEYATYGITYNLAGGVNAGANPAVYTEGGELITLVAPTRAHYDFIGWTYAGVNTPVMNVTIDPTTDSGDKEYTADKCIISVGRSGSKWMESVCADLDIPTESNRVDIGVRV